MIDGAGRPDSSSFSPLRGELRALPLLPSSKSRVPKHRSPAGEGVSWCTCCFSSPPSSSQQPAVGGRSISASCTVEKPSWAVCSRREGRVASVCRRRKRNYFLDSQKRSFRKLESSVDSATVTGAVIELHGVTWSPQSQPKSLVLAGLRQRPLLP